MSRLGAVETRAILVVRDRFLAVRVVVSRAATVHTLARLGVSLLVALSSVSPVGFLRPAVLSVVVFAPAPPAFALVVHRRCRVFHLHGQEGVAEYAPMIVLDPLHCE